MAMPKTIQQIVARIKSLRKDVGKLEKHTKKIAVAQKKAAKKTTKKKAAKRKKRR